MKVQVGDAAVEGKRVGDLSRGFQANTLTLTLFFT
jgi:hypothetical protein